MEEILSEVLEGNSGDVMNSGESQVSLNINAPKIKSNTINQKIVDYMKIHYEEFDSKTIKLDSLYKKAALEINQNYGFEIVNKNKVRLRWQRLKTARKMFIANAKSTGRGAIKRPPFFDDMAFLDARPLFSNQHVRQTIGKFHVSNLIIHS